MRKILISGGSGFLGVNLVETLKARGDNVVAPSHEEWDLHHRSPDSIRTPKFDIIFHLAVDTSAGDYCLTHKADQWISNQLINLNMIGFWRYHQPQAKLVTMGTSCSYDTTGSMREQDYLKGDPDKDLRVYAMTKRMLLEGLVACQLQDGLKWLHLIPSTLYGRNFTKKADHFIFDMLRKVMKSKETGEKIQLWGSGKQERELVHVKDFIKNMIRATEERKLRNTVLNLGCGRLYELKTIAEMLCAKAGVPVERIEWDTTKYEGEPRKALNTEIGTMLLGNLVHTDLDSGLQDLVRSWR